MTSILKKTLDSSNLISDTLFGLVVVKYPCDCGSYAPGSSMGLLRVIGAA
jgi:hypothetical protein